MNKRIEFSAKMKKWFFKRDDNKCQAPFSHVCDTEHPLQLHHILPHGYLNTVCDVSANYPENGIILCRTAHEVIHPDVVWARNYYHKNTDSFSLLKKTRRLLLDKHKIYWNDKYDRPMTVIALINTRKYKKPFPEYHPRRKNEVFKDTETEEL
jgi:hypothetical protein